MAIFDIQVKPRPNSYHEFGQPKKKRRKLKYFLLFLILLGVLGFGTSKLLSKTNQIFTGDTNIFNRVVKLLPIGGDNLLVGEDDNQINVLLLRMGGPGHP